MFSSLLIANRGEIARRIMRTARAMGLRTIAVYSDADREAAHVSEADQAFRIGPPPPKDSYLSIDAIVAAARQAGADAVHPGYGFLSENADFAEACRAAGLVFVGPPPDAIRAMGRKDAAKALMARAGVPVVPGYHGDRQGARELAHEAALIGYPVLIKAVAGGGGRGMRRVDRPDDFARALESAVREAQSAFGDSRVLIERYVDTPRHIEVQVFADRHGQAVHLFERDCSLQRRHQKVLEEAPAPGMTAALRARMGEAAVMAARTIGYEGAGTVEFIVEAARGLTPDGFYFMEMNTRLQVEHPVTEMITGEDLVAWQLRVAAGEPLPKRQSDLAIDGHALEVRLYAEDPAKNFLPSTGQLTRLQLPAEDDHIRVDAGVREGDGVSMFYDPLIAKIIAWDRDRAGALRRMGRALAQTQVAGVRSNLAFLAETVGHPAFAAAELDTGFIDRHREALVPRVARAPDDVWALAVLALLADENRQASAASSAGPVRPFDINDGFRLGPSQRRAVDLADADGPRRIIVQYAGGGDTRRARIELESVSFEARATLEADGLLVAWLDGVRRRAHAVMSAQGLLLLEGTTSWRFDRPDPLDVRLDELAVMATVAAPLPGRIVHVAVAPGQPVRRGDLLVMLEAMKMEHALTARADGRVSEVRVAAGDQVSEGQLLVAFAGEG